MGYEFSWANFATIEVMSSQRFGHKRVGYLSAAQSFNEDTDVILLTTNLLKKEFGSSNVYEVGLAINCLSNIVTQDLARELLPDLTQLTQHSHGYIRKKAVLCLFKLFMKYPQGLRLTFDRIKQCLDDSEPAVVSCAVNVITELADKNPKNYLLMAPHFFSLLTSSSNNWMLIKVVKLLGSLVSEEPRLARKLLEPLAAIVQNTQAKSLLYEAVYTLTLALPFAKKSDGSVSKAVPGIVELCADKLKSFVEEADQNLKYLGLVGFVSLMRSHPKAVVNHRNLILRCLCDDDVTIRSRALELLTGMVTRKNLQELVDQLMQHVRLSEGDYRDELIQKIIFMCSRDKYAFLTDFKWYISVLVVMSRLHGTEHGAMISSQIMDVATRVFPVRDFCVGKMVGLLLKSEVVMGKSKSTIWEVLHAAAWVVGEYANFIDNVDLQENVPMSLHHSLLSVLLSPSSLGLPSRTQAVFVQAAIKVFAAACNSGLTKPEQLVLCLDIFQAHLPLWMKSKDIEVQERASSCYRFLTSFDLLRPLKEPELVALELEEGMSNQEGTDLEPTKVEREGNESPLADDLLGLVMSTTIETPVLSVNADSTIITSDNAGSGDGSFGRLLDTTLTERCREHARAILAVCVPEPMKPVNAKAQKRLAPPSFHGFQGSLRAGLFHDLIQEDSTVSRKRKLTIEEVSFGFFGARATMSQPSSTGTISFDETGEIGDVSTAMSGNGKDSTLKETPSQSSHLQNINCPPGDRVDGTPFYLTDSGVMGGNFSDGGDDEADADFGEIRLGASESDDDNSREGAKRPERGKGKKKKSKKKKERKTDDSFAMREDAMAIFGGDGVGVYQSDEEANGDESDEQRGGRAGGAGQEFDGLAQIDLTTPLAPDEVMPERKHREVPEHRMESPPKETRTKKKKKKKKGKREKKMKKKESTADLLDFGAANDVDVADLAEKVAERAPPALNTMGGDLLTPVSSNLQNSTVTSLNLKPDEMATLDSLASEFVTGEWAVVSTKVKNESGVASPIRVIARMLNASIVDGSVSDDGSYASLAATGKGNKRLRVLVKCKGKVIKLDFKSNSKKLAKSASKMFKELAL